MRDSVKNYWKLGKDQFGDTLWMEKPRKTPQRILGDLHGTPLREGYLSRQRQ